MNRSALLLFAIAARSSSGTLRDRRRASGARGCRARFDRGFQPPRDGERQVLLERAARSACAPSSSPPWPGSIAIVRIGERGCASAGSSPAAAAAPWRRRGVVGLRGDHVDGRAAARGVDRFAWSPGSAPKRGPRSTAMRRGIERRGSPARSPAAEAAAASTSSASASNLIVRRWSSCVTVLGVRGVASIVRRAGVAERLVADRDARHAQVADDEQARGARRSSRAS